MKKFFYLPLILILVFSIVGCGNDQYAVEKAYWKNLKQSEKIFTNPHATPPNELDRVVSSLQKFIQKNSGSSLAREAEFNIARLYIVKEEYSKAREVLRNIITKYKDNEEISAEAVSLIGSSFEIDDKWPQALEQYRKIMQDYPLTRTGLEIPIYIAQHYKIKYQPDRMLEAYQQAVEHYKAIAAKYPNTPAAFTTLSLAAECYMSSKNWNAAINTLQGLASTFKEKINVDGVLFNIALIYADQLKDKQKAIQYLEQLKKDYPKSKLMRSVDILLKELNKK